MITIEGLPNWTGQTAVIAGGGPSLTQQQLDYCRGRCRLAVTHHGYERAPWADLFICASGFCNRHFPKLSQLKGTKVAILRGKSPPAPAGAVAIRTQPREEPPEPFQDPTQPIWNGWGAGIQSLQIVALCQPSRILLLGYDNRPNGSWHGDHKGTFRFSEFPQHFRTIGALIQKQGIGIVNCTPNSAIDVFPRAKLEEVL